MDESNSAVLGQQSPPVDVDSVPKPPPSPSPAAADAPPAPLPDVPHDDQKPRSSLPPPTQASSSKPHSTVKPKSKAANAAPPKSPSPPPPPPPTLTTVRLQIKLSGPENYQVDIAALARETGQRPPTPVQKRADTSESEEEDDAKNADETANAKPKSKKKKKNTASEYYDVSDPFIDDSELALDERTYFAQTKQQGFYVSSGEVALMKDHKTPVKKPKSRRPPLTVQPPPNGNPNATSASTNGKREGTKDSPIALISDSETETGSKKHTKSKAEHHSNGQDPYPFFSGPTLGQSLAGGVFGPSAGVTRRLSLHDPPVPYPNSGGGQYDSDTGYREPSASAPPGSGQDGPENAKVGEKRKRYTTVVEGGKKRKVVDITSFHPDLQRSFEVLKDAIVAENWETKGKFPPSIKPLLSQIAIQAIKLDEYDEHFFNLMPILFPYNKFTMSKLIKRTVFADHTALLVERQDNLLKELKRLADEGFAKAEEEWEKNCQAWDKRQKKAKAEAQALAVLNGGTGDESASNAPTRHPSAEDGMDVDNEHHDPNGNHSTETPGAGKEGGSKEAQPPGKKFRLTETMKAIVWELVLLSNECCRLENEKNTLEGSVMQVSEQGLRKVLYQKMLACFPPGWMSTGQISRDVSAMKKKLEKELEQEQEES
ncbi:hypothetical protein Moror_15933 [Moniliophthora roreri MCA 2997]|uniref:Ubinuclein middle domain-containing protein n=1 Tax=Moniliophthora roreri (strain MCA 2997) TaxID=1381753 RepID=V2XJU5_MONRO|nr:hypothetical protein Moror_15933 [Moniliophthora roreri MCA 2997]